jgi:hypothetical protein
MLAKSCLEGIRSLDLTPEIAVFIGSGQITHKQVIQSSKHAVLPLNSVI